MKAKLGTAIGWLSLCALVHACANDTGRPKDDGSAFGSGGFIGVVPVTPPSFGSAGTGVGGFGSPTLPMMPTTPTTPAKDCPSAAKEAARGLFSDACVECLCRANPMATLSCGVDCWKIASCVSANCERTDTNCIVATCAQFVGGVANLADFGAQTRQTPFDQCPSTCSPPLPISDGGPENDF